MANSQAELGKPARPARHRLKQIRVLEMAAHLQNPISGVLAASQFLIEMPPTGWIRAKCPYCIRLDQQRTMLRVLEDMLEIPTIDAALPRMDFQPTDLRTLVEQSVRWSAHWPNSAGSSGAGRRRRDTPASADPVRTGQALRGLLTAAVKGSRAGGRVALTVTARWNHAVIAIANDGPDSSAEAVKYLLGPADLRRLKGGLAEARTALTMARVKRIIDAHRGTTQAESSPDQGFALTLTLPIARRAKSGGVPEPKRRLTQGGK